jgi:trk system potassium uptake protein TrkH
MTAVVPPAIVFWRSRTQWLGGISIVVSTLGVGANFALYYTVLLRRDLSMLRDVELRTYIGPGLSAVGPTENFAFFASWQKLVMILLMWLGRLAFFAVLALFQPHFWRR